MSTLLALLCGSAQADIIFTGHVSRTQPTSTFTDSIQPGLSVDTRVGINLSRLHLGISLNASFHDGLYYRTQADVGCAQLGTCIQGDIQMSSIGPFAGILLGNQKNIHFIPYAALQLTSIPLLMDEEYYAQQVVQEWDGIESSIHTSPLPNLRIGADILFPIRDSDVSIGIQPSINYIVGLDMFWGIGFGFSI